MFESLIQLDKQLVIYLNNLGSEQWDWLWLGITNQFYWSPVFALIFYLVIKTYGWKRGGFFILMMIVLVAFSDQFVNLIKNTVGRLRPNNDPEINHLLRILKNPQGKSFISGHATTSTFFSLFVCFLLRERYKKIYFLLIWPVLFAYSRLYLGVHFPLDILCGAITGIILGNLYFKLIKKLDTKYFPKPN